MVSGIVFAGVAFDTFNVIATDDRAEISWKTTQESNLKVFAIERSADGSDYYEIATFTPQGAGYNYRFTDTDLFKQSIKSFYYRIKVVDINDQVVAYSETRQIRLSLSGIQQTWGSLKAMFK